MSKIHEQYDDFAVKLEGGIFTVIQIVHPYRRFKGSIENDFLMELPFDYNELTKAQQKRAEYNRAKYNDTLKIMIVNGEWSDITINAFEMDICVVVNENRVPACMSPLWQNGFCSTTLSLKEVFEHNINVIPENCSAQFANMQNQITHLFATIQHMKKELHLVDKRSSSPCMRYLS